MSKKARSVQNIEGRILRVLSKTQRGKEPTNMALCAMSLDFEVRDHEEQMRYDLALFSLLKEGVVVEELDEKGFKIYRLAA